MIEQILPRRHNPKLGSTMFSRAFLFWWSLRNVSPLMNTPWDCIDFTCCIGLNNQKTCVIIRLMRMENRNYTCFDISLDSFLISDLVNRGSAPFCWEHFAFIGAKISVFIHFYESWILFLHEKVASLKKKKIWNFEGKCKNSEKWHLCYS